MKMSLVYILVPCIISCENEGKTPSTISLPQSKTKPPSGFVDTLKIHSISAVFFYPDSIQLEKIKAITEKNIYDGSMHEYFYQVRNAHIFLKKNWPEIEIIEAKNVRFLQFARKDQTTEYIDLDRVNDAYGLFVFDTNKPPSQIELTNAESGIGFYFATNRPLKSE